MGFALCELCQLAGRSMVIPCADTKPFVAGATKGPPARATRCTRCASWRAAACRRSARSRAATWRPCSRAPGPGRPSWGIAFRRSGCRCPGSSRSGMHIRMSSHALLASSLAIHLLYLGRNGGRRLKGRGCAGSRSCIIATSRILSSGGARQEYIEADRCYSTTCGDTCCASPYLIRLIVTALIALLR
jgi:hypothetical protein